MSFFPLTLPLDLAKLFLLVLSFSGDFVVACTGFSKPWPI